MEWDFTQRKLEGILFREQLGRVFNQRGIWKKFYQEPIRMKFHIRKYWRGILVKEELGRDFSQWRILEVFYSWRN